jgi:hypothetical protein
MKQLIAISETIQKMSKARFPPDSHVVSRTFVTNINGRKGYIGKPSHLKVILSVFSAFKIFLLFTNKERGLSFFFFFSGINIVPPETLNSLDAPLVRRQSAPAFKYMHLSSTSLSSIEGT